MCSLYCTFTVDVLLLRAKLLLLQQLAKRNIIMFVVEFRTTFDDTHDTTANATSTRAEQHDTAQDVMAAIAHCINASSSKSATEEMTGFNTSVTLEIIEALKEEQKISTTNVFKSWEEDDDTMIFTHTTTITIKRI